MDTLTFEKFMSGDYPDDDYSIYIVRYNAEVLYIGISRDNIYNRWFTADYSHITKFANGALRGNSTIGQVIVGNLPNSLQWSIDLWSIDDCIKLLGDKSPCKSEYDNNALDKLERYLISELNPLFNVTHNTQRPTGKYIKPDLTTAPCDVLGLKLYQ
jgi:hypothetical protein